MKKIDRVLLAHNVESIAAYDFDQKKVFGAAYAVVQNNELIYQKCFGHTSSDCSAPVTTRTLFRMASMTKPISAFATLILVDRGMLSLDDAVGKYLPEFAHVHVTVRDGGGKEMDLGEVGEIAELFVNGISCGVCLESPFRFYVGDAWHTGENAVEIVIATNCAYRRRDHMSCLLPLPPTGLLGPVRMA